MMWIAAQNNSTNVCVCRWLHARHLIVGMHSILSSRKCSHGNRLFIQYITVCTICSQIERYLCSQAMISCLSNDLFFQKSEIVNISVDIFPLRWECDSRDSSGRCSLDVAKAMANMHISHTMAHALAMVLLHEVAGAHDCSRKQLEQCSLVLNDAVSFIHPSSAQSTPPSERWLDRVAKKWFVIEPTPTMNSFFVDPKKKNCNFNGYAVITITNKYFNYPHCDEKQNKKRSVHCLSTEFNKSVSINASIPRCRYLLTNMPLQSTTNRKMFTISLQCMLNLPLMKSKLEQCLRCNLIKVQNSFKQNQNKNMLLKWRVTLQMPISSTGHRQSFIAFYCIIRKYRRTHNFCFCSKVFVQKFCTRR